MSDYNRQEQLKQLHLQRRALTERKASDAIDCLLKEKRPVNFKQVAKLSGISAATLYKHENIKQRIIALRNHPSIQTSAKNSKADVSESGKDAIIASLKRRIEKLERDNHLLRNQLKGYAAKDWEKL